MAAAAFTLLDDGRPIALDATVAADRVTVAPAALHAALGWTLKPEGLCRDAVCVPVRNAAGIAPDGIDLGAFAALVGRPFALDAGERVAWLGVAATERAQPLDALEAPAFTLPDLDGRPHGLADFRGRKVFLLAFASW